MKTSSVIWGTRILSKTLRTSLLFHQLFDAQILAASIGSDPVRKTKAADTFSKSCKMRLCSIVVAGLQVHNHTREPIYPAVYYDLPAYKLVMAIDMPHGVDARDRVDTSNNRQRGDTDVPPVKLSKEISQARTGGLDA